MCTEFSHPHVIPKQYDLFLLQNTKYVFLKNGRTKQHWVVVYHPVNELRSNTGHTLLSVCLSIIIHDSSKNFWSSSSKRQQYKPLWDVLRDRSQGGSQRLHPEYKGILPSVNIKSNHTHVISQETVNATSLLHSSINATGNVTFKIVHLKSGKMVPEV